MKSLNSCVIWLCMMIGGAFTLPAQTLPPGPQVLTFFSDLDDTEQPYSVYIPQNYDETKKYPLVVMLHGAGSNHRLALRRVFGKSNFADETDVEASRYFPEWKDVGYIVVAPYARGTAGYQGFVEKDVLDMLADVKHRFTIDENRMYLTGLSMGGGGTLWIGLSHPDLWAAIAPVCPALPPGTEALAPNALNMAVQFVHGDADPTVPVSISRDWVAKLKTMDSPVVDYLELPGVNHWSWVGAYEDGRIFDWFSKFTRNPFPDRVRHVSYDLKHGKSYWVRMDEKSPGEVALIDAVISDMNNTVEIKTSNLTAFTLLLEDHPKVSAKHPLQISINGQLLSNVPLRDISFSFSPMELQWFSRQSAQNTRHKRIGLEGPIEDAFASRHIYVYGTADNPTPDIWKARLDTVLKAADWSAYRGEFLGRVKFYPRVLADRELRKSDYESANLILFGTAESNRVIAEYASELPLHLNPEAAKEYGLTYIFPNIYSHYVVVSSGLPWWRARDNSGWRYFPEVHTSLSSFQDFILFKRDKTMIAEGYFSHDWKLTAEMKTLLMDSGVVR
ncbi:MAG TPA: prolyl oligopeptidase family serine peptidase [Saprospiraceae bacterium]|nr:prolyl oligopeptidase family serine peptidase [Saprospiraceae bacterium]